MFHFNSKQIKGHVFILLDWYELKENMTVQISYGYQCLLGIFSVSFSIICTGLFFAICLNNYARRLASPVSTSSHNI